MRRSPASSRGDDWGNGDGPATDSNGEVNVRARIRHCLVGTVLVAAAMSCSGGPERGGAEETGGAGRADRQELTDALRELRDAPVFSMTMTDGDSPASVLDMSYDAAAGVRIRMTSGGCVTETVLIGDDLYSQDFGGEVVREPAGEDASTAALELSNVAFLLLWAEGSPVEADGDTYVLHVEPGQVLPDAAATIEIETDGESVQDVVTRSGSQTLTIQSFEIGTVHFPIRAPEGTAAGKGRSSDDCHDLATVTVPGPAGGE